MNNFYNKILTFNDIVIVDDYNPINKDVNIENKNRALIICDTNYNEICFKLLRRVLYYGAKFVIEIYIKPNSTGIMVYLISIGIEYINP